VFSITLEILVKTELSPSPKNALLICFYRVRVGVGVKVTKRVRVKISVKCMTTVINRIKGLKLGLEVRVRGYLYQVILQNEPTLKAS
jgi:hypothetical protein